MPREPAFASSLESERLLLRQFEDRDLDAYAAICSDEEVMAFLGGKPYTRAESWRHMATMLGHWQLRGFGIWAVVEKASGALVGRVGFNDYEGWPGFELAWTLSRNVWGCGYASEAARRALTHAFDDVGRDHVISLIHPENHRSIAVAERIGERLERTTEFYGFQACVYGIDRGKRG